MLNSPSGLNFSATFRSEAKEKFKVNLESVYPANKVSNQDTESKGNFVFPKDLNLSKVTNIIMTKMLSISSDENVKYVTFELDSDFTKTFQNFLSDIGISRDKRKNLFKNHYVYTRGGRTQGDYKDTLQVVHNKDRTINIEIFAGSSTVIVAIHYTNDDVGIGNALGKHFEFKSS